MSLRSIRSLLPCVLLLLLLGGCVAVPFDAPAGPHAGEGSITIRPDRIEAAAEARFRIDWTAGPSGAVQGGGFRIDWPVDPIHPYLGFTPPQRKDYNKRGRVTCAVMRDGQVVVEGAVEIAGREAWCLVPSGRLGAGETLAMEYWALAPRVAGTWRLSAESRFSGGGGGAAVAAQPVLEVIPRSARSLHVVLPGAAKQGDPMTLAVVALDEFGNRARDYRGTIDGDLAGALFVHEFTSEEQGIAVLPGLAVERPGFHRAVVRERPGPDGPAIESRSNPVKVTAGPAEPLLWGDLHFHTGTGAAGRAFAQASDAGGDHRGNCTRQEEAWAYARDVMRLDFAAATEHAVRSMSDEAWQASLSAANDAHDPPRFTAINGFQWNDRLVLLAGARGSLIRSDDRLSDEMGELQTELARGGERGALIALRGGDAAAGADAAEIYSWRNRGHGYDDRPRAFEPASSWSRLGDMRPASLVAGSDNHWGHPGTIDATGLEPGAGGLTAVRAAGNDREPILDALRRGRAWATTGARIYLSLERLGGDQIRVEAAGTSPFTRIDLVIVESGGVREMGLLTQPSLDYEAVTSLPDARGTAFCYVRAEQEDGELAWSSPLGIQKEPR